MAYIIDASCLIQAKNEYYDFDFHPGFWDWLLQSNKEGKVYSIDQIFAEIDDGLDTCALKMWSKANKNAFFLPLDNETMSCMTKVASFVQTGDFGPSSKHKFLAKADPFLVAYSMAHNHTVVRHEVANPGKKDVKIPTVCKGLGVPCMRTFQMLKNEQASFISAS